MRFKEKGYQWNVKNRNIYDYNETFTNKTNFGIRQLIKSKVKIGDHSRGWPEVSFFNSYCIEMWERVLLLSLDRSILPLLVPHRALCKARKHQILFSCLWYEATWNWTLVSRAIGEYKAKWKSEEEQGPTVLLKSVRILSRVLLIWEDLLPLRIEG